MLAHIADFSDVLATLHSFVKKSNSKKIKIMTTLLYTILIFEITMLSHIISLNFL